MQTKCFEIRDAGTFIPVIATLMSPDNDQESYLLGSAGFSVQPPYNEHPLVILCKLHASGVDYNATYSPFSWGTNRTMQVAHSYIQKFFHDLSNGQVIDVEYILGETTTPKRSQKEETSHL